jgi:REP element-mobilizing transposase RayT
MADPPPRARNYANSLEGGGGVRRALRSRMSIPRQIIAGATYLLTRRVTQRKFLLRPCPLTEQIILYALAYAASLTGVLVHAVVVMSNHIHLVVTDPEGRLPEFLRTLHRHIACCMNKALDRRENFWSSTGPNVVTLEGDDDVLAKIAYVISNPTAAGLVDTPADWPGLIAPAEGMSVIAERPPVYYSPKGKMPESIGLQIAPPSMSSYENIEALLAALQDLIDENVRVAKEEMTESGRTFIGPAAVLATEVSDQATTPESRGSRRPVFAARNRDDRRHAIERLREFQRRYASALHAWRMGDREVAFPPGTWMMRVLHGVRIEPLAPDVSEAPARPAA